MGTVNKSVTVDLPVTPVYNQWTQFEDFPEFMEGVESVTQLGDNRVRWAVEIAGVRREWDAEIIDQTPDRRLAWQAIDGTENRGEVVFQPEGPDQTRIDLTIEYETEGLKEKAGDILGVVDRRVEGDLDRFKRFIESQGDATGAWRGDI